MRKLILASVYVFVAGLALSQTTLEYVFEKGEQYRVLSMVEQDVWINGLYSHHATILNRISVEVEEVTDGRGYHNGVFVTSEEATGGDQVFTWGEEYRSEFWLDSRGRYEIDPSYFMPVVRDVPVLPDRPLVPGDNWYHPGYEVHDFRRSFGIPDAYQFPIPVGYTYQGTVEEAGRQYAVIGIEYNVFYRPTATYPGALYPVRISGSSRQTLRWDIRAGRPHDYEETYTFVFVLSSGDEVLYDGTAESRVVEASRMDRTAVADNIREELADRGLGDQAVVEDERGVTIRLDTVQFPPDSDYLRESERRKLDEIGEILMAYPDRDILVSGHTALAGTEAGRLQLSEARAAAVAGYLLETGVRQRDEITLRGVGAAEPVAPNDTEEGMRRNRRVEITILEN